MEPCVYQPRKAKVTSHDQKLVERHRQVFPRICRKNPHYQHPDFRLLASRTVRQYLHFWALSHPVCGPLLEQPWEIPGGSVVKNSPANAGDMGSIPGSGRSPGEGNGYLLQYSCLQNPMDREAWRAIIHGVA